MNAFRQALDAIGFADGSRALADLIRLGRSELKDYAELSAESRKSSFLRWLSLFHNIFKMRHDGDKLTVCDDGDELRRADLQEAWLLSAAAAVQTMMTTAGVEGGLAGQFALKSFGLPPATDLSKGRRFAMRWHTALDWAVRLEQPEQSKPIAEQVFHLGGQDNERDAVVAAFITDSDRGFTFGGRCKQSVWGCWLRTGWALKDAWFSSCLPA